MPSASTSSSRPPTPSSPITAPKGARRSSERTGKRRNPERTEALGRLRRARRCPRPAARRLFGDEAMGGRGEQRDQLPGQILKRERTAKGAPRKKDLELGFRVKD